MVSWDLYWYQSQGSKNQDHGLQSRQRFSDLEESSEGRKEIVGGTEHVGTGLNGGKSGCAAEKVNSTRRGSHPSFMEITNLQVSQEVDPEVAYG